MNKKIVTLIYLLLLMPISTYAYTRFARKDLLMMGTMQFPSCIKTVPSVRMYCSGNKIACEVDKEGKRLHFSITDNQVGQSFFLVIADSIQWVKSEENTIEYLKIDPKKPYKLYSSTFTEQKQEAKPEDDSGYNYQDNDHQQPRYAWNIEDAHISENGKIPDHAIIICYNADFIEGLEGGNARELPRILVKSDILTLVGSETALQEASIMSILSGIDSGTIHSTVKQQVKAGYNRTILALTV